MPQSVIFPKLEPQWIFGRDCAQFFAAVDGEHVLKCLVSAEALYTHFGARDFSMEEALRAFLEHREEIEAVAQAKILNGNSKRGDEVLLRMADFPAKTPSRALPPRGLYTVVDPAITEDPWLLSGGQEAKDFLEQELVTRSRRTTASWDLVPVLPDKHLVQLTLTDDETKATRTGLFSAGDLANLNSAHYALFRLWDDLLQERGRRRLESLQDASNLGGEAGER